MTTVAGTGPERWRPTDGDPANPRGREQSPREHRSALHEANRGPQQFYRMR